MSGVAVRPGWMVAGGRDGHLNLISLTGQHPGLRIADVEGLASRVLGLLDGTRTEAKVIGALPVEQQLAGHRLLSTLADNAPQYAETIGHKIEGTQEFATSHLAALTNLIPGLNRATPAPYHSLPLFAAA